LPPEEAIWREPKTREEQSTIDAFNALPRASQAHHFGNVGPLARARIGGIKLKIAGLDALADGNVQCGPAKMQHLPLAIRAARYIRRMTAADSAQQAVQQCAAGALRADCAC
jgi:hypothetical protein